ncbi:MAG: hypothetical protein K6F53_12230 [Lachnospiraceae bacterium]|nr:hypothetical protein [Lachnospiraceae bacterium]
MIYRKTAALICAVMISGLFSGCAMFESAIPEMSEDEHNLVVEYATETLLRYDTKNGGRVNSGKEQVFQKPEVIDDIPEGTEPAPAEEILPEPTPEPESMTVIDNPDAPVDPSIVENTESAASLYTSVEQAIGMSEVLSVQYAGYQVSDYFPEDIGNYFVMNAQDGYKLLVLKFNVINKTGSDLSVEMPYRTVRYKIELNGEVKNALSTLLLNDLAAFKGTIPAGGSEELVVIGEYMPSEIAEISSLRLVVKADEGDSTIDLQ